MRMTNNISTLIKGLVIAFAITIFIPSASHATWEKHTYNNYNNNSYTTCSTHTNYKNLAMQFKNKYYYRYSYYRSYLYYIKLYNQHTSCNACKSTCSGNKCKKNKCKKNKCKKNKCKKNKCKKNKCKISSNNCSKYKSLAANYLNVYYKCYNYGYYTYYLNYMKKYNQCNINYTPTTVVCSTCGQETDSTCK